MSSLRKAEIARQLNDWLFSGRYNPPKDFRGNEKAEQVEAEALLGVLLKFAPQLEPASFISRVLDQLEYQLKVRVWPNKQEMGSVCANVRKQAPRSEADLAGPAIDMRDIAISARRMQRGEPVGEGYLWGRMAVEMIGEGLIEREVMQRYRSRAFLDQKNLYGEAVALAWEAEAKARHEAAKAVWQQRNDQPQQRDTGMPDKSAPYEPSAFAAE